MLKFLNVVRIFNFHIFLVDFSLDFKHVVLSCLDELPCLLYMVEILEMSSFQHNLNRRKTPLVPLDMSQIEHEDLVWKI
jgi:hypothetical protein